MYLVYYCSFVDFVVVDMIDWSGHIANKISEKMITNNKKEVESCVTQSNRF